MGRHVDPATSALHLKAEMFCANMLDTLPDLKLNVDDLRFTSTPHFRKFFEDGGKLKIEDLVKFPVISIKENEIFSMIDVSCESFMSGYEVVGHMKLPNKTKLLFIADVCRVSIFNLTEFYKILRPSLYEYRQKIKKPFTRNHKEEIRFYEEVVDNAAFLEAIYAALQSEWTLSPEIKIDKPVTFYDRKIEREKTIERKAKRREYEARYRDRALQKVLEKQRLNKLRAAND